MLTFRQLLACLVLMISFSLAVAAVADAQSVTGTISGAVQDPAGAPVAGAQVRFSGESSATANTDSAGHFAVERPPGAYRLAVSKAGYQTATSDLVVVAGQNQPIAVVLQPATLASLKVVGSVVSHGGSFNTSPASSETISGQTFITQAQPQVMQVLNETPGIVASYPGGSANGAVPGAITFPNIRGALSFETASLIDGHPVSVGQFGDYVTTFLNPFVLGSIEVVKGPGAAAPETNFAIGGTVNFRTKDPTYKPQATMTLAADSFGGRFGNFGYSGTTADQKLGWVLDYAFQDTGGPFNNQPGMFVPNGATIGGNFIGFQDGANAAGYPPNVYRPSIPFNDTPIVACCQLIQSNYKNEAELAKLRYNFSPSTTATFTFLGTQTVADQTANNSQQTLYTFDPTTSGGFPPNTPPTPYTGPLHTGTVALQAPFFPGADIEHNNEPIFEGEVRTTAGKDSVIARAYTANIHRLVDQGGDNPATPITQSLALYGTIYDGNGNPVNTYNGEAVPVQFNAYFHQFELDALAGYSLEWDHPFATDDLVTVAYDHTHSSTYAGVGQFVFGNPNSFGISTNVPKGSSQDFGTLLVRGLINAGHKLSLTFANYFNSYKSTYAVGCVNPSSNPPNTCPANTPATPPPFLFATGNSSHYDGRLGVVYRPDPELAVRLAVGSAIAPPYLGLLSNVSLPPTYFGGDFATQQISGNNLQPETAFGYDIGADFRSRSGVDFVSTDLYLTNLFNQFITQSKLLGTCVPDPNNFPNCIPGSGPKAVPLFGQQPVNLSNARYEGIELAYRHDPPRGFGWTLQGALQKAYPYNLSACFYYQQTPCTGTPNTNLGIIANQNYFGGSGGAANGVSNQSIPYSQAYGELRYRFDRGLFLFGETYYGTNNSLNVKPFFVANATLQYPLTPQTMLQLSAYNLFNANSGLFITTGGGVPIPLANGQVGLTNSNVIGPRRITLLYSQKIGSP